MTITEQELKSRLKAAANALRGPVDPADFKTYVFPMLLWKWISDTWVYEHDQELKELGDDLDDEVEADYHRFDIPEGTLWSGVTGKVKNLGAEIAKAFQRIEKANPRSLVGVFGDASWGNKERLPESELIGLIKAFNEVPRDPTTVSHDLLGAGHEHSTWAAQDRSRHRRPDRSHRRGSRLYRVDRERCWGQVGPSRAPNRFEGVRPPTQGRSVRQDL